MDVLILTLGILGLALAGTGITGLAFLVAQQADYQLACWRYGQAVSRQQQAQRTSKRVIEIHIS